MRSRNNRKFKNFMSLFLAMLMLVTVVPVQVRALSHKDQTVKTKQAIDYVDSIEPSNKISDKVKKDMQSQSMVEAIVYMKDKLDSIAFSEQSLAKYSQTMSAYDANLQVRRDLVLALKDQSHRSQYNLRQLVNQAEDQVEEFQSFFIANVAYVKASPAIINKISLLSEVEKITENTTYYLDDYKVEEENLELDGDDLWSLEMVHAPETWALGIDGEGAVVGLLDSGTDYNHPALHDSWRGLSEDGTEDATYSWYDTVGNEPLPVDSDSHGTHVCGTMVGRDEEADITIGVAPGAEWICARVFNTLGSTSAIQLIEAAEWMIAPNGNADMAPDVVNNSWGGGSDPNDWYIEAVDNYIAAGIIPVFSAGNRRQGEPLPQPGSISNPAHYENSFAVAAIDENKLRASFSKRGPSPYTDNWKPDISAPGVAVYSSMRGGSYGAMSGTSMAAPHISGAIALMRSANQSLTVDQLKSLIYDNAEPLTDDDPNAQSSPNHDYGYGLVNVFESITTIASGIGRFTGKVLRAGEDTDMPVLQHEQSDFEIHVGSSIQIEAFASDDVSVVKVSIMVKAEGEDWQEIIMRQVDGDYKSGNFVGTILPEDMGNSDFQYKVVAEDFAGHKTEVGPFDVVIKFGAVPGEYFESFEDGTAEGWVLDPVWQIGSPSMEGEPFVPHGEQYIGTIMGGNYGPDIEADLISVPIDMRNSSYATARFMHWHNFGDYADDYGTIYVTNDYGETLTEVATFDQNSDNWLGQVIDLSAFAYSTTPVFIVFHFVSEPYPHLPFLGWYIDMFSVEGEDTTAPDAPTNLTAEAGASAIRLEWDFQLVPDLDLFEIYRSTEEDQLGEVIGTTDSQFYLDSYAEDSVVDTDYYYRVKAKDIFGNVSEASNQAYARKSTGSTIASWDFEENDGAFTLGQLSGEDNDWEWGEVDPDHGPGGAFTGSKVWGTGLDSNYTERCKAYIQTPAVDLPEGSITLTMNHWYHFEMSKMSGRKWDYGQVHVKSENDTEWVNITPEDEDDLPGEGKFGGPPQIDNPGPGNWKFEEIDLSDYAGQTIELRFIYFSDDSGSRAGWFINDVNIIKADSSNSIDNNKANPYLKALQSNDVDAKNADFSIDFNNTEIESKPDDFIVEAIPVLDARVSVIESGQSVASSKRTAIYNIRHNASEEGETWTLKAEAYGYEPEFFESSLAEEEVVTHDFFLEPKGRGTIKGQVFDRYSKDPAPFATVTVVEDPNVEAVTADENGYFTIDNVYSGEYTLHAVAEHFESGTASVSVVANEEVTANIALKRFVGYPGEIIYDDGTADNATVLLEPGNGVGMRFTPEKTGKLLSASFYFYDSSWPEPGGNEIGFAVFVKEGINFRQIGETIIKDDVVRGGWTTVDFSSLNFITDEDFYVTTVQTQDGDHSPGHGLNESGAEAASDRSYFYVDGSFMDFPSQDYADYCAMIRATLEYAADTPVITNLEEVNYTNQDNIDVSGMVDYSDGQVCIYANDALAQTIEAEDIEDNVFDTNIELLEEETEIKASLKVNGRETEPSESNLVIKDQTAPDLLVLEPSNNAEVNVELIHVKGQVSDDYLASLTINGDEVSIDEDGNFNYKVIVNPGKNNIEVRAYDKAGNETVENLTVYVRLEEEISISDMQPAEDVTVSEGESVEVSFTAPENGSAQYTVVRPLGVEKFDAGFIAMTEEKPGYYKATWTAQDIEFEDAEVVFDFTDSYGNNVKATAPGKISVKNAGAVERIFGSNRYKTAVEMSRFMYDEVDTVILASGENFPDALVGGLYAEEIDVPILLSRKAGLPNETLAEIRRLKSDKVIILGGDLAINADVEKELKSEGLEVQRIAGSNRYKTAVKINELSRSKKSKHVYLTCGHKFADALSIAPIAAKANDPVLLTKTDSLHEASRAALSRWNTEKVTILGGDLVVSKAVESELISLGYEVERIEGSNRYKTNIDIVKEFYPEASRVIAVSGEDFADAMLATVYAAKEDRPIILLDPEGLRDTTVQYFLEESIEHVLILGGPLAIPKVIEYHIKGLLH